MDESLKRKIEIQKEAELAHIKMGKKSTLCLSVGSGKGKIAINRIKNNISEGRTEILFFGAREVYLENFKKELIKFDCEQFINNITFICNRSLKNYIKRWDLIIYDEAHRELEIAIPFLKYVNEINKDVEILCLTGTPKKFSELYELCPVSYIKVSKDAVNEKILNDYKITIVKHNLSKKEMWWYEKKLKEFKDWQEVNGNNYKIFPKELHFLKAVFKQSKSKEELLYKVLNKWFRKRKVLIYAGTIKQAKKMNIPAFHSQMSDIEKWNNYEKFCSGEINQLVNVNSIKEAVSIPDLKYGIVMAIDASPESAEQLIGRFLRLATNDVSSILIFCAKGTIEENYVKSALKKMNADNIRWIDEEELFKN